MSALDHVRHWVDIVYSHDLPRIEVNLLAWSCVMENPSTLTMEDATTDPVKFDACDSEKLAELLRYSRSAPQAYDACIVLAEGMIENGTVLPPPLGAFVLGVMRGERSRPKRRGRSPYKNLSRNMVVKFAVEKAITAASSQVCHREFKR